MPASKGKVRVYADVNRAFAFDIGLVHTSFICNTSDIRCDRADSAKRTFEQALEARSLSIHASVDASLDNSGPFGIGAVRIRVVVLPNPFSLVRELTRGSGTSDGRGARNECNKLARTSLSEEWCSIPRIFANGFLIRKPALEYIKDAQANTPDSPILSRPVRRSARAAPGVQQVTSLCV